MEDEFDEFDEFDDYDGDYDEDEELDLASYRWDPSWETSSRDEAIEKARAFEHSGISFCLVTEFDGKFYGYERPDQPCYGELRKYHKIHEDDYTDPQPHDEYRPSDLYYPFPREGKPIALSVAFVRGVWTRPSEKLEELMRFVVSEESPWRSGLGKNPEIHFEIAENNATEFQKSHLFLTDLALDPTVLVNLLNCSGAFQTIKCSFKEWVIEQDIPLIDKAFMVFSIDLVSYENSSYIAKSPTPDLCMHLMGGYNQGYYMPLEINLRRFFEGNPHDLTGGTLEDRYDYNRTILHEVFGSGHGSEEPVVNLLGEVRNRLGIITTSPGGYLSKNDINFESLLEVMMAIKKDHLEAS